MKTNALATGKNLAIMGLVLQLGPYIGLLITIFGVTNTFSAHKEPTDLKMFSAEMTHDLIPTWVGLICGLLGIVLIFISLVSYRYRAQWFFWFLMIYGTLSLFMYPIGTVIGLALLVFCLTYRKEFFRNEPISIS